MKENQKPVVLIVDDEPKNLALLTDILSEYDVRAANSGEAALKRVQEIVPDLILLDIVMPGGIDGYEVCRQIKGMASVAAIPIVFVTALTSEQERVKGFEAGAIDYVTKPYLHSEVLMRVRTHLAVNQLTRQMESLVAERTMQFLSANQKLTMAYRQMVSFCETKGGALTEVAKVIDEIGQTLSARELSQEARLMLQERLSVLSQSVKALSQEDFLFLHEIKDRQEKRIDLQDVITRILADYRAKLEAYNVQVAETYANDLEIVWNENSLYDVILNVLEVSLQYGLGGSGRLSIATKAEGDLIAIKVKAERERPVVNAHLPGFALGVSREIVEQHGGSLAEMLDGAGSEIIVYLPG